MVVLEDLHWADTDSLALLEFLARELAESRLLILGNYRDVEVTRHHPLSATLAELSREHLAERIVLGGLSEREVAHFVEAISGIPPPAELVEAVHTQTEGNPLFVTEILRLLEQEGELTPERIDARESWIVGIPEGVREVIDRRLGRLSEGCSRTLSRAAVIGREFSFGALSDLIDDLSEDDLLDVLEEALAARVIEELVDAVDSYQFTHALIQEVCAQELSATRRVRLHARIAQVLEELYGTGAEAHAAELAQHYAEAEAALGPDKLVHYSRIAGDRALAAHAYEEATAQFARALAAKEGQPTDAETANLLFGLARAEFAGREQPDLREALGHLRRAFDYYTTVGDAQRAVAVAAYPIPPMYGQTGVPELMAEALELARADSPEEGRLLSTLGWFLGINDADYERSREAFDRSLAIAQRLGEQALETRALVGAAAVDYFHLKWRSCVEDSARALELALAAGDERTEMIARGWAARVSAVTGDLAGGRAHAAAALDLAEKLGERYWLATAHIHKEWLAVLAGDAQAARASSEAGLALQPEGARNLGSRALLEYQLGEFTYGDAYLDRLLDAADSADPAYPSGRLHQRRDHPPRHRGGRRREPALLRIGRPDPRPARENRTGTRRDSAQRRRTGAGDVRGPRVAARHRCPHRRPRSRPGSGPARGYARRARPGTTTLRKRPAVLRSCRLPSRTRLDGFRLRRGAPRTRPPD